MPGKQTVRFGVANLDQWGKLIKSWATDLDYISQPYASQPPRDCWVNKSWPGEAGRTPAPETVHATNAAGVSRPWCLPTMSCPVGVKRADGTMVALPYAVALDVKDFKKKAGNAGVILTSMPEGCTNVVIVQGNTETMVIRLPPSHLLQSAEDDLLNGVAYPFPPFYAPIYHSSPTPPTSQADIMLLDANRIGDYSMSYCA
jgi:hypothetical protein